MKIEKQIIGNAELYCGDCAVILPQLDNVDLILTDPPYGISAEGGTGKYGVQKFKGLKNDDWDSAPPKRWLLDMMLEKAPYSIIFGGNYFSLPPTRCYLAWDKGAGFKKRNFAESELAWTNFDAVVRNIIYDPLANGDYHGSKKEHPTQKPVPVMEWCISQAPKEVETILDPFMGSGTTGVACHKMGKRFIGIERERKYFDIACRRIEDAQKQHDMFGAYESAL